MIYFLLWLSSPLFVLAGWGLGAYLRRLTAPPVPPPMPDNEPRYYGDTQYYRLPSIMHPTCRMFSPHGDHAAYEAERAGTAALLQDALTGKPARWEADVSGTRIHCYRN